MSNDREGRESEEGWFKMWSALDGAGAATGAKAGSWYWTGGRGGWGPGGRAVWRRLIEPATVLEESERSCPR